MTAALLDNFFEQPLKVGTNSDMVVSYHAATTKEVSSTPSSMGYGYGPAQGSAYGRYGGECGL